MLLGSPLRADTSRRGNASPDDRNADRTCEEWTTALTRYGSRGGGIFELILSCSRSLMCLDRGGDPNPAAVARRSRLAKAQGCRSLALAGAASPCHPPAGHPTPPARSG